MGTANLKDELHTLIEKADFDMLELVYAILSPVAKEVDLDSTQVAELDRRYELHRKNPGKGASWEEVNNRISNKSK